MLAGFFLNENVKIFLFCFYLQLLLPNLLPLHLPLPLLTNCQSVQGHTPGSAVTQGEFIN